MRIVIAGAAGNLGSEITTALIQDGHEVIAMDASTQRLEPMRSQLAGLFTVDLRQPEQIANVLDHADLVITTVGIGRPQKLNDFQEVDYQSNLNLLKAAQKKGISRFIYISVAGVDTDLSVPLLKAKYDFEQELIKSGIRYLIIRPSSYFTDVWRTFMLSAQKGKITLIGTREPFRFSPVHPGDVARFIADHLEPDNRAVSVGGPEQFTYEEISKLCFELLGKPPKLQVYSVPVFDGLLAVLKILNPALWSVMRFLRWASTTDLTCPGIGKRTVREYFLEQLQKQAAAAK
jgi:uncharacterized protein YbjT (DUF2867 family)